MTSTSTPTALKQGFAIASLVLGILSILTLGACMIPAVVGIILGIIAISKTNRAPAEFGGKNLAIVGIITNIASFALLILAGMFAAIIVPQLQKTLRAERETQALDLLKQIQSAENRYFGEHRRYATMTELMQAKYLPADFTCESPPCDNIQHGYEFAITASDKQLCIQATRNDTAAAKRDYSIDHVGQVRYREGNDKGNAPCDGDMILR